MAQILGLLDESLSAITTSIAIKHVIVSGLESDPRDNSSTATPSKKLPKTQVRVSVNAYICIYIYILWNAIDCNNHPS